MKCLAYSRAPLCFILTTRYSLLPPCRQLEWLERRAGFCPEPKSMLSACPIPNFQLPPCLHPPSPNPQLFLGGRQTSENGTGAMRQRYPHSRMGKRFCVQDRLPQPRSLQAACLWFSANYSLVKTVALSSCMSSSDIPAWRLKQELPGAAANFIPEWNNADPGHGVASGTSASATNHALDSCPSTRAPAHPEKGFSQGPPYAGAVIQEAPRLQRPG